MSRHTFGFAVRAMIFFLFSQEIAWKAHHRLHTRYRKLTARGKDKGKVVTAIGRELLGFIWALGVKLEAAQKETERRAA